MGTEKTIFIKGQSTCKPKCMYRRAAKCMKQILMNLKEGNSVGPACLSTTDKTGRKLALFLSRTPGDIARLEGSPAYSLYSLDTDGKLQDPSNSTGNSITHRSSVVNSFYCLY